MPHTLSHDSRQSSILCARLNKSMIAAIDARKSTDQNLPDAEKSVTH
jgi:hypothetical protein